MPSRSGSRSLRVAAAIAGLALAVPGVALADRDWNPRSGETARALSHEGNREAGARAYAACAVCHGATGLGRSDGTFPRIAGQYAPVVVKQIEDIRAGRRGNPIMASHVDALTDPAEIADVAVYVASLAPAVPAPADGTGDDPQRERGETLYRRDCVKCHGADGSGSARDFVPIVAGQSDAYLLRQLRAIAGSLRRNAHPAMVDAVFDYSDDDLRAVATYLASLPWPATAER